MNHFIKLEDLYDLQSLPHYEHLENGDVSIPLEVLKSKATFRIVHCKECKYWNPYHLEGYGGCTNRWHMDESGYHNTPMDTTDIFFCAAGRYKEEQHGEKTITQN